MFICAWLGYQPWHIAGNHEKGYGNCTRILSSADRGEDEVLFR